MENNTFLNKINEIRQALDFGLYNCALALALTIPDICGKVEYPAETKSSLRYKSWFIAYAQSHFTASATQLPGEETVDCVIFSAEECWALRCAVLHAGNYETEKTTLSRVLFHAHKREGKNYSHIVRDSHFADFDVIYICEKLCNAAKNYYSNSQNKNRFDVDEVRKENSYAPQNTIMHFMDRNLFGLCGGTFHDGPVSDENAKSVDQLGRFPGVVFAGKYSPGDILFGQHMAKEAVPQAGTVRGGAFRCEYPHRHRGLDVFHCSPADAVTAGLLPPRKQGESV